jgi:hypothetical protein
MQFFPDSYSQGTNAYTPENKFGQAGMFDKPNAQQQGNFGGFGDKISALVAMLRGGDKNLSGGDMSTSMPESNAMPQMTPMQQPMMGANMGQVNNPNMMSPNNQIMPNYNRTYGGFNGSNQ